MSKGISWIAMAAIIALSVTHDLIADGKAPAYVEGESVLHLPRAPLRIFSEGSLGFRVLNTSKRTVGGYKLGCVKHEKGGWPVAREFDFQERTLKPKEGTGRYSMHEPPEELRICGQLKARLAVVFVKFNQGQPWSYKP
jgi:hypothetical protein